MIYFLPRIRRKASKYPLNEPEFWLSNSYNSLSFEMVSDIRPRKFFMQNLYENILGRHDHMFLVPKILIDYFYKFKKKFLLLALHVKVEEF